MAPDGAGPPSCWGPPMPDAERMQAAEELVDSYGPDGPLVRLAAFASPACRVEPQLLRRLRFSCVPDADVGVEQELWFSELVASRGREITFVDDVVHVLRRRLREEVLHREAELVDRARRAMADRRPDLPLLLQVEEEVAWAEVDGDAVVIHAAAARLHAALLAGREGLDHWLVGSWGALPDGLKRTPEGRELAEVAAASGAEVERHDDGPDDRPSAVAHLLPSRLVLLGREGSTLRLDVAVDEATHAIDVPDTRHRVLSIRSDVGTWSGSTAVPGPTTVGVGTGVVTILTESGDEFELEAVTLRRPLTIELLPAGPGTSVLVSFGEEDDTRHLLVNTGDRRAVGRIRRRLGALEVRRLEALALVDMDATSLGGAPDLLQDGALDVGAVWFNDRETSL